MPTPAARITTIAAISGPRQRPLWAGRLSDRRRCADLRGLLVCGSGLRNRRPWVLWGRGQFQVGRLLRLFIRRGRGRFLVIGVQLGWVPLEVRCLPPVGSLRLVSHCALDPTGGMSLRCGYFGGDLWRC